MDNDLVLLREDFNHGKPAGWTTRANQHPANIWRFDDPGGQGNQTGGSGGFAIADSDKLGQDSRGNLLDMDTELVTPELNASGLDQVRLSLRSDFRYYSAGGNERCDLDVSVNGHRGPWINVWRVETDGHRGPRSYEIDLSPWLAGRPNVAIRFRYHGAKWDWWWQVDDVLVTGRRTDAGQAGVLALASAALDVAENAGHAVITVQRFGGSTGAVGGRLRTVEGTATPGLDYVPFDGLFTIPSGGTSASIAIPIIDDDLHEGNETFTVVLSAPTGGAVLVQPVEQVVTILDDEGLLTDLEVRLEAPPAPLLTRLDIPLTVTAINHGPSPATGVRVEIPLPPEAVYAGVVSGQGSALHHGGLVVWQLARLEPFEQVQVTVTLRFDQETHAVFGATIAGMESDPARANNEAGMEREVRSTGTLGFGSPVYAMDENGGSMLVDVVRTGGLLGPASVAYAMSDGTATAGADYVAASGVLHFEDGELLQRIELTSIDDDLIEGTEYFHLTLGDATGAALGQAHTVVTIHDDDIFSAIAVSGFESSVAMPQSVGVGIQSENESEWLVVTHAGVTGWRFDDPGARGNQTGGSDGFAIADSAYGGEMETELRSPVYDLSGVLGAALACQTDLAGNEAQARLFASVNGRSGPWSLLWEARQMPLPGPARVVVDIRSLAGHAAVCFSFRYSAVDGDGWWALDDFELHGEEDQDGDGLPDWWEILHFGSIAAQDGDDDFDRNGVSNLQELRAGTDPTNPESRPAIRGIRLQGGRPVLQFEGSPERLYDIEATTLPGQDWQPVTPTMPGTGGLQETPVDQVPGDTPNFYRLRIRSY